MLRTEDKFELIHFGKEDTLKLLYSLSLGETLMTSNTIRDLGVIVHNNITRVTHINSEVDMASRM